MSDTFSSSADPSAAVLTICIDFKSPLAYLAKDPSYHLQEQLAVSIDWQPLLGAPLQPPTAPAKGDDRGTRHRRYRADALAHDITRYAEIRGLQLDDIYTDADSSLAGIGLLWVKQQDPEIERRYIDLVFERFWRGELDIESLQAMTTLLQECTATTVGLDEFASGVGRAQFDQLQIDLRQAGVFNVPAYLLEDEIFYGRAHLPMIGWMLSGRQGEPPI
jgi:2-hydroxychromene-2-carboxylate isomerase|tara:strand:+ start:21409 stop:22065 length:657 start_codon:yes stop_codon:yes gene_type:complete